MMKVILLLAFAALCVLSAPTEYTERQLLTSIIEELNTTLKDFPQDAMGDVFLNDLKVKGRRECKHKFFCNAEKQLRNKISGKSGTKFEPYRTDKALIRNLHKFNNMHNKTCKPADNQDEILLHEFLEDLRECVRAEISGKKN